MLDGFVRVFRDSKYYLHLFFFRGIDENMNFILNELKISDNIKDKIEYEDGSVEYIYENRNIISITVTLVNSITNKKTILTFDTRIPKYLKIVNNLTNH